MSAGEAFKEGGREAERRRQHNRAMRNAKANTAARREYVYSSELTLAELVAERDRLKRECRERNPTWFGEAA